MSTTITRIEKSTPDKRLRFDIPVDAAGQEYRVEIKLLPEASAKGWPPGFLEKLAGSWVGEFVRDQGQFEQRQEL